MNQNNTKKYKIGDIGPAGGYIFMQYNDGVFLECWIEDEPDRITWDIAYNKIKTLNHGGFSDWTLPTIKELNKLYKKKNEIGNFEDYYYWTSIQYSENFACCQTFSSFGSQGSLLKKESTGKVRAVRRFK